MYTNAEENYNLYDKIISATYANIYSLSKDKDIILKDFDYKCETSKVFLEVACMVAYMTNKEIYVQGSFISFLKARFKKKNKHIHWIRKRKKVEGIETYQVAAHEALAFKVDTSIFIAIFKSYYERKKS